MLAEQSWKKRVLKGLLLVLGLGQWKLRRLRNINYTIKGQNGKWLIIKFKGNGALYSLCLNCGFTHPCYKEDGDLLVTYDDNFCPNCGEKMKG